MITPEHMNIHSYERTGKCAATEHGVQKGIVDRIQNMQKGIVDREQNEQKGIVDREQSV